ncbi:MAG: methyltransferase [Candidatus Bathyarchaeota archaeon B63]|nr:MAG: methyltransferase [Candidatus Bathyarchaeota archaeon B63]
MRRITVKGELKSAQRMTFKGMVFYVFRHVYPPAEDTFLLAEHLEVGDRVLDVGTGCGILSVLSAVEAEDVVATDINPYAAACARLNAEINGVSERVEVLVGDLLSPLREEEIFDTILFNAPYLPTGQRSERLSPIEYAWTGGEDGRMVIDRFIQQAPRRLKPGGRILLVQSSLSGVKRTLRELRMMGLRAEAVDEQPAFFERIVLIEALS